MFRGVWSIGVDQQSKIFVRMTIKCDLRNINVETTLIRLRLRKPRVIGMKGKKMRRQNHFFFLEQTTTHAVCTHRPIQRQKRIESNTVYSKYSPTSKYCEWNKSVRVLVALSLILFGFFFFLSFFSSNFSPINVLRYI